MNAYYMRIPTKCCKYKKQEISRENKENKVSLLKCGEC